MKVRIDNDGETERWTVFKRRGRAGLVPVGSVSYAVKDRQGAKATVVEYLETAQKAPAGQRMLPMIVEVETS